MLFSSVVVGQIKKISIDARISLQADFQKASFSDTQFSFQYKEHSGIAANWGFDILAARYNLNNLSFYGGLGYFRNSFRFKRAYDHALLNKGSDSIPIGTNTRYYTFHLLRLPLGLSYPVYHTSKHTINVVIEATTSFSLIESYVGAKAYPTAKTSRSKFTYFGNSMILMGRIISSTKPLSRCQIEPYIRILNFYDEKNEVLYEYNSKPAKKMFDSFGMAVRYRLN